MRRGSRQHLPSDLLRERLEYESKDPEGFFDAERNAALVKNAERYYRAVYYGPHESWNLRDKHMFETLRALLRRHGRHSRAVVWAHNSHLGNAAATTMSARGETNVGELCRNAFGDDAMRSGSALITALSRRQRTGALPCRS